ncbi:hypothetical protein [Sphingopyxis flava]|uniref:Uncharacterized protein n=1 Tax=Sphingopyxis flava TaxID=1507287 RepID=A0A1T5G3I9_9SPHN|nr:hypothetical protein [Sphingopyxis flava]SKC02844.1 hypothetical protein SAMN06295937_10551 [Sphingopyxis flava]
MAQSHFFASIAGRHATLPQKADVMARTPSQPPAEPRGFFERTRFEGILSGHGASIPMGFYASIDQLGVLRLELDRIPFSRECCATNKVRIADKQGLIRKFGAAWPTRPLEA